MVGDGGDEDARDDGPGRAETRGQQQRQQLCLVADFGERDDASGDEEGFHEKARTLNESGGERTSLAGQAGLQVRVRRMSSVVR